MLPYPAVYIRATNTSLSSQLENKHRDLGISVGKRKYGASEFPEAAVIMELNVGAEMFSEKFDKSTHDTQLLQSQVASLSDAGHTMLVERQSEGDHIGVLTNEQLYVKSHQQTVGIGEISGPCNTQSLESHAIATIEPILDHNAMPEGCIMPNPVNTTSIDCLQGSKGQSTVPSEKADADMDLAQCLEETAYSSHASAYNMGDARHTLNDAVSPSTGSAHLVLDRGTLTQGKKHVRQTNFDTDLALRDVVKKDLTLPNAANVPGQHGPEDDIKKHMPKSDIPEPGRKRGRPPGKGRKKDTKRMEKSEDKKEEDVCFVCFDGGDLILCDKRSCPKAYHMECTGRELEYFEKKGQWFCGWHVCAHCSKSAMIQCYTCPTAFCCTCLSVADFLCIRKGQGLCEVCCRLVQMIEQNETMNADGVQIDFDDQETYEGLFKDYWENVKRKFCLSAEELEKASKAKANGVLFENGDFDVQYEDAGSTDSDGKLMPRRSLRLLARHRVTRSSPRKDAGGSDYEEEESEEDDVEKERIWAKKVEFHGWASKDLLCFMKSIKVDTRKPLSLLAVKKMLWAYIEENNLIHVRWKGQITCDERLQKLFGRQHVGRLEIRKLLRFHIAQKRVPSYNYGGSDLVELENSEDDLPPGKGSLEKQQKLKGKSSNLPRSGRPDPTEFAAIDVNNINLIYLKRPVLEDLRSDSEFANKVIGAFVRIRVPGILSKADACYRLVPVIGVKQTQETLNPGKVILKILNLQKHEEVAIDEVSGQDFSQEECDRLQQSFKYGFLKPITVGELEEKARDLRAAKLKEWFESEILRLTHLRDRASEKGHKKELRECVEKLQLFSSPVERERQLIAPLQINVVPFMDLTSESQNEGEVANTKQDIISELKSQPSLGRSSDTSNSGALVRDIDGPKSSPSSLDWGSKSSGNDNVGNILAPMDFKGGWGEDSGNMSLMTGGKGKEGLGKKDASVGSIVIDSEKCPEWVGQPSPRNQLVGPTVKENDTFQKPPYSQSRLLWKENDTIQRPSYSTGPPSNQAGVAGINSLQSTDWRGQRDRLHMGYILTGPHLGAIIPVLSASVEKSGTSGMLDPEKEKIWHYQDPTRTIQGPFSMEQLRKWEKTKLFPVDLRIWKTTQSEDESILLTDALSGKFPNKRVGYVQTEHSSAENAQISSMPSFNAFDTSTLPNALQVQGGWNNFPCNRTDGVSGVNTSLLAGRPAARDNGWIKQPENTCPSYGPFMFPQGNHMQEPLYMGPFYNNRPGFDDRHVKKKDIPCRYFLKGICKKGQACDFKHE